MDDTILYPIKALQTVQKKIALLQMYHDILAFGPTFICDKPVSCTITRISALKPTLWKSYVSQQKDGTIHVSMNLFSCFFSKRAIRDLPIILVRDYNVRPDIIGFNGKLEISRTIGLLTVEWLIIFQSIFAIYQEKSNQIGDVNVNVSFDELLKRLETVKNQNGIAIVTSKSIIIHSSSK